MNPRLATCAAMRSLVRTLRQCAREYKAMEAEELRRESLRKAWWYRCHERQLREPLWPEQEFEEAA